ncbi:MAG: SDR family oxidoreductase [Rickettsiaceae bacterium]|nr:SDR family oxidoreductase [Rickettsiaceae bacterium]
MNKPLVIITGASSGIGSAMAKIFSVSGYSLGLIARNLDAMKNLNLPNSICLSADVSNKAALENAINAIKEKLGPVDCLINNAGVVKTGDFTAIDHNDNENMIKVNLLGLMNGIEIVLPSMVVRRSGTIINISSIADRNARPKLAVYAATKSAVKSLTESLRMANAKHGIRICNLAPAKIKTPMLIEANINDDEVISSNDLARAALWIYQQPQNICIRDLVIAPTCYEP